MFVQPLLGIAIHKPYKQQNHCETANNDGEVHGSDESSTLNTSRRDFSFAASPTRRDGNNPATGSDSTLRDGNGEWQSHD
jgi:hypothetical protein